MNKLSSVNRRRFFRKLITSVAISVGLLSASQSFAAQTWKMQSVWDAGTLGYTLFEEWCNNMKEATNGELILKPFPAKSVAADNNALFDNVRYGVLQGMNPFTMYWSGKIPSSVFMTSFPAGPDQPHQWDTLFYSMGMLEKVRAIYKKFGLYYVGPVQHDANIIHSKKSIQSLADLKGMKIRLPGGMVAETFQKFGVSSVNLPGSDIFPALEKGTIDAADYVGPAVNWDLGFHQVTKHILFGPPGVMSIYQPVDLMDITVNLRAWNKLKPEVQKIFENEVRRYSQHHFLTIQKRNVEAMAKFKEAGSSVSRLSQEDMLAFRRAAVPIWYRWAKKDKNAQELLDIHLDYLTNEIVGYLKPEDLASYKQVKKK